MSAWCTLVTLLITTSESKPGKVLSPSPAKHTTTTESRDSWFVTNTTDEMRKRTSIVCFSVCVQWLLLNYTAAAASSLELSWGDAPLAPTNHQLSTTITRLNRQK